MNEVRADEYTVTNNNTTVATPTPVPEATLMPEPQVGDWKENDMVTCEWQGSTGCGFYYSGDPYYVDVGPVGKLAIHSQSLLAMQEIWHMIY